MRWHRFGDPAFLVAVATLALNDRVLKAGAPGWFTGKLSDVAGVVVVAWAASAVLDRTPAVAVTAVGFTALKVVPGVAEAAVPVLGGETLRDPTDLLALAALVPTWWLLGRPDRRRRAVAAPVLGGLAAVLSVTATTPSPTPSIAAVAVDGDELLAFRSEEGAAEYWLRSDDEGDDWASTAEPSAPPVPLTAPATACDPEGRTCVRIVGLQIERSTDGGETWDLEFTDERPRFHLNGSIATTDGEVALAAYGTHGVLVRDDDGSWEQQAVGGIGRSDDGPFGWLSGAWIAVLVVGVLFVGVFGLVVAILAGLGYGFRAWRGDRFDP